MAVRADAADNERRIVAAAIRLGPAAAFYEVGKAAGVGQGTLYRRFADAEALARGVIRTTFEEPIGEGTLFDRMEAVSRRLARVRPWADRLTEPEDVAWFRAEVERSVAELEPEWREGQRSGRVDTALTLEHLRLAIGMVAGSADETSAAVDLLRRGLERQRVSRRPRPSAVDRVSRVPEAPEPTVPESSPRPPSSAKRGRPLPSQRR